VYYDALLAQFDHAAEEGFLKPLHRGIVIADPDPATLVDRLLELELPVVDKWIDRTQA
jgi:hypothetical protein